MSVCSLTADCLPCHYSKTNAMKALLAGPYPLYSTCKPGKMPPSPQSQSLPCCPLDAYLLPGTTTFTRDQHSRVKGHTYLADTSPRQPRRRSSEPRPPGQAEGHTAAAAKRHSLEPGTATALLPVLRLLAVSSWPMPGSSRSSQRSATGVTCSSLGGRTRTSQHGGPTRPDHCASCKQLGSNPLLPPRRVVSAAQLAWAESSTASDTQASRNVAVLT